jgi:transcriptional regulator of acetoin/glycerol metabolism
MEPHQTAKALGIHKNTLFRKIKALQIQIPASPDK